MGRVSRFAALLGALLAATGLLGGCDNALTSFLQGAPFRREMARLAPTPNVSGYGFSVDISGDYMIVGEPYRDGNLGGAWIYHRVLGETWDSGTLLPAPVGAAAGDYYGYAVATNGEYAVLGAPDADTPLDRGGSIAIYGRNATTGAWDFVRTFKIGDIPGQVPTAVERFGNSLAMDGAWLAVGAREDNDGEAGEPSYGAVYVFVNSGGTWGFDTKLRAETPQANSSFGFSVDISGDVLVVGSHYEDIEGTPAVAPYKQGAVYIFRFDTDNWDFAERIQAPDPDDYAMFGVSVGISGDWLVVGSPGRDSGTVDMAGAAYVFQKSAAGDWHTIPPARLSLDSPRVEDWYGWSAAISGDTVLIGSFNRDHVATNDGAVFVYARAAGNSWNPAGTVSASDAADNLYFGMAVALDATRAAIGATAAPPTVGPGCRVRAEVGPGAGCSTVGWQRPLSRPRSSVPPSCRAGRRPRLRGTNRLSSRLPMT